MDHIITYHDKEVNDGLFIQQIGKCSIGNCRVPAREGRKGIKSPRLPRISSITNEQFKESGDHEHKYKEAGRRIFIDQYHAYLFHPIIIKNTEQYLKIHPDRNSRFVSVASTSNRLSPSSSSSSSSSPKLIPSHKKGISRNHHEHDQSCLNTVIEECDEEKDVNMNIQYKTKDIQNMVEAASDDDVEFEEKYGGDNVQHKIIKSQSNKPLFRNGSHDSLSGDNCDNPGHGLQLEMHAFVDDNDQQMDNSDDSGSSGSGDGFINEALQTPTQIFSFSHKYSYHKFRAHKIGGRMDPAKDYVGCKYENLKKELIEDSVKNFDIDKWNLLISNSSELAKKDYCKNLKAKRTNYGWNTQPGKSISIARIVAIQLYTNYDSLQLKLCETYRKDINYKKKQKQEHSRFAHWAKLLRSTVDLFGEPMTTKHKFFRGLSGDKYVFSLFSTDFNAPCSTTTKPGVAWSFAVNGIVVQIEKPEWRDGARFMSVKMFSAYKTEEEHLFCGPDNYLQITSIHQNLGWVKTSTKPLILLQLLTHRMHQYKKIDIQKLIHNSRGQISDLCKDLQNRKNTNEYSSELTNHFVGKKKRLWIKIRLIHDLIKCCIRKQKSECQQLLSWFIEGNIENVTKHKSLSINFDGIIELFPECSSIIFDFTGSGIRLSEDNPTWNNMIHFLGKYSSKDGSSPKNRSRIKLTNITFKRMDKYPRLDYIGNMEQMLMGSRWDIWKQTKQKIVKDTSQESGSTISSTISSTEISYKTYMVVSELSFYKGGVQTRPITKRHRSHSHRHHHKHRSHRHGKSHRKSHSNSEPKRSSLRGKLGKLKAFTSRWSNNK